MPFIFSNTAIRDMRGRANFLLYHLFFLSTFFAQLVLGGREFYFFKRASNLATSHAVSFERTHHDQYGGETISKNDKLSDLLYEECGAFPGSPVADVQLEDVWEKTAEDGEWGESALLRRVIGTLQDGFEHCAQNVTSAFFNHEVHEDKKDVSYELKATLFAMGGLAVCALATYAGYKLRECHRSKRARRENGLFIQGPPQENEPFGGPAVYDYGTNEELRYLARIR